MTVEEMYEMYKDDDKSFAEDLYNEFMRDKVPIVGETDKATFLKDHAWSIPSFDPTGIFMAKSKKNVAEEESYRARQRGERELATTYDFRKDQEHNKLLAEIDKARRLYSSGGQLKSGSLTKAIEDTITSGQNIVGNLDAKYKSSTDTLRDTHNEKITKLALDFEKDKYKEKEEWYDAVMKSMRKLAETGAFREQPGSEGVMDCVKNTEEAAEAHCWQEGYTYGSENYKSCKSAYLSDKCNYDISDRRGY